MPSTARAEKIFLLALGAAFLLFAWPVLKLIVQVYETNPDYSHGYLIPLIAVYACSIIWKESPGITLHSSWLGLPLILAGAVLMIFSLWSLIAIVETATSMGMHMLAGFGLWLAVAGLCISVMHVDSLRRYAFPLLYLLFTVPLPANLTAKITLWLRGMVTACADALLNAGGMVIYREGNLLHLATVSLGVEDACSGIRSLWVMVAWAVAAAWITGCRRGRFLLIIILALPIAFVQNLLRVLISAVLAEKVDPLWAEGWRHETVGWFTFLLAAALFVVIANGIAARQATASADPDSPARDASDTPAPIPAAHRFHSHTAPLYMTAIVFLGMVAALIAGIRTHYYKAFRTAETPRHTFSEFPDSIGDYRRTATSELSERALKLLAPEDAFAATYHAPDNTQMSIMLLFWPLYSPSPETNQGYPHSPDVCFPSSGWTQDPNTQFTLDLPVTDGELQMGRIFRQGETRRVLAYWRSDLYQNQAARTSRNLLTKAIDRLQNLGESWGNPTAFKGVRYAVYISCDVAGGVPLDAAQAHVIRFAGVLRPQLVPFGIPSPSF